MNYKKAYDQLIKKAQSRLKPNCYVEEHHILPRCLGGSDDSSNLVYLTGREHCLAHLLLAKIYGGKLWHAANIMTNRFRLTSRAYSAVKKNRSESMLGENHPMWNKKHTEETLKKLRKPKTAEHKLKLKQCMFGKSGENSPAFDGPIIATNIKTGETKRFNGNKELLSAGFSQGNVSACTLGKRKTHKGYTFERVL